MLSDWTDKRTNEQMIEQNSMKMSEKAQNKRTNQKFLVVPCMYSPTDIRNKS